MKRKKKVVVVLPAYNAQKTLKKTFLEIPKGSFDEILLVDDYSIDKTVKVAKKLGLDTIIHLKNQGYGANQKTCYLEALKRGADIIVMLHPDYQYDPKILPSLTTPIEYEYADVVLASRILGDPHLGGPLKGGMPFYKFLSNRFLTVFQNLMLNMNLSEYHTGYRAYSRKVLEDIDFKKLSDDFIFDNQILVECIKKGFIFKEVPVATRYFKEASSIGVFKSIKYGLKVIGVTIKTKIER